MLTVCLITPGDVANLLGGYRYHTGDQPGHVVRPRYCDEAKVGRLNRSADVFVLLSWDSRHNIVVIVAGQVHDTGLG